MRSIAGYSGEQLNHFMREMLLIRRFEEKAGQMYGLRKIGGFCHLYNGQEAVAVGSIKPLDLTKDYVLTAYRDHGHALTIGTDPRVLMSELFGKVTGSSRGKGGSMHMFDASRHFLGGNGIVGAQIPIATGVAYATEYRKTNGVTLCYFGDGAIHQGAFHESVNLAKIWNLPILYICENNEYGMGTYFGRVSSVTNFAEMAGAYGIPGLKLDGMDVIDVYEGITEAVKSARDTKTPQLIEIRTYRYRGHSMSDPATYRTKDDVERAKGFDPIVLLRTRMNEANLMSDDEFKAIDDEVKRLVDDAVRFAEESSFPSLETIYEDVLA